MSRIDVAGVRVRLGATRALDDVTLDVRPGEWLGLIGPNGAGKSTLLRAIAGLVPFEGSVMVDGVALRDLGRRGVARRFAYVAQDPIAPEDMRVRAYVLLGRLPHLGYLGRTGAGDERAVARVIDRLDLTAFADRPLGTLSGGERQRAVLARALAQDAPTLLLDEPTSALDVGRQQQVLELVEEFRAELGLTVIAAMHDLTLAAQHADRLVLLDVGRIAATGAPRDVLTTRRIASLYGASVRVIDDADGFAVVPVRLA